MRQRTRERKGAFACPAQNLLAATGRAVPNNDRNFLCFSKLYATFIFVVGILVSSKTPFASPSDGALTRKLKNGQFLAPKPLERLDACHEFTRRFLPPPALQGGVER